MRRYPGWYLDPEELDVERFWNGERWTDLTRRAAALVDYLGPIEPLLLRILGDQDPTRLIFGLVESSLLDSSPVEHGGASGQSTAAMISLV